MLSSLPPQLSRNARQLQESMDSHELLSRSCLFDLPFTLAQLCILKAIAAEGNFTRAASILYLTQPTVSCQIQHLERQVETTEAFLNAHTAA
jgi:DNA-binding MarR family transcriptional regulator